MNKPARLVRAALLYPPLHLRKRRAWPVRRATGSRADSGLLDAPPAPATSCAPSMKAWRSPAAIVIARSITDPEEIRLAGGAANSALCRKILAASVGAPVRIVERAEAGAAGAALDSGCVDRVNMTILPDGPRRLGDTLSRRSRTTSTSRSRRSTKNSVPRLSRRLSADGRRLAHPLPVGPGTLTMAETKKTPCASPSSATISCCPKPSSLL